MDEKEEIVKGIKRWCLSDQSTQASKGDTRVTQMINEVLVSKPVKKEGKPQVIDLQQYAKSGKAGSVSDFGINKAKEIADFINARNY